MAWHKVVYTWACLKNDEAQLILEAQLDSDRLEFTFQTLPKEIVITVDIINM